MQLDIYKTLSFSSMFSYKISEAVLFYGYFKELLSLAAWSYKALRNKQWLPSSEKQMKTHLLRKLKFILFLSFLQSFLWLWMNVDGCGWLWEIVGGCEWLRVVVDGGWLWLVVAGCGWLWVVVAGCGWLWMVAAGCIL